MSITRLEDIKAWQAARALTQMVYALTRKPDFSKDFGLKDQIRRAAGSSMHNIAEGFDANSNADFIRFLRYAKRSCTEVQSQLYVALDQNYITPHEFKTAYQHAGKARAIIAGFIKYLNNFKMDCRKNEKAGQK